jgi:hypothetical protein
LVAVWQAQDDNLFVTLGDHFVRKNSHKNSTTTVQIVRITPDRAARRQPLIGNRVSAEIWPTACAAQGLAFNPADGSYRSRAGPIGATINIIEKTKLRLAACELWSQLRRYASRRQSDHGGRHRPDLALDAFDRTVWNGFYTGDLIPGWKGSFVKRGAEVLTVVAAD